MLPVPSLRVPSSVLLHLPAACQTAACHGLSATLLSFVIICESEGVALDCTLNQTQPAFSLFSSIIHRVVELTSIITCLSFHSIPFQISSLSRINGINASSCCLALWFFSTIDKTTNLDHRAHAPASSPRPISHRFKGSHVNDGWLRSTQERERGREGGKPAQSILARRKCTARAETSVAEGNRPSGME